jgi:hypothetical protein
VSRSRRQRDLIVTLAVVLGTCLLGAMIIAVLPWSHEHPAAPASVDPGSASLRQVDGGPRYYERFPKSLPSDPSYFPLGIWLENVQAQEEIDADKQAGINLYVGLTGTSDLTLIARNGLKVIAQLDEWLSRANEPGAEAIAGWFLSDEVDMQMSPAEGHAKMRSLRQAIPPNDGRLTYANYGKGVTFWNTLPEAARYVNEFQDVVSADNYWFTDRDICGAAQGGALHGTAGQSLRQRECRLASNYGRTVAKLRELTQPPGSRPVWAFVEVGHPFTEDHWPSIEPAEVSAAVWSSLIHGARGVVYFNHSFGGPAPTQHALREPAYADVRREVARTNARIQRLAPVLNSPFVNGFATTPEAVDTMTKRHGNRFYVFAGSRSHAAQRATFQVPCAGEAKITVLDENRTLRMSGGTFEDSFADGNAFHVYRVEGDAACWLPTS